jgi:hypothetical protein
MTEYSCPNCGHNNFDWKFLYMTPVKFVEEPDPHYEWMEVHECDLCETVYHIKNGS